MQHVLLTLLDEWRKHLGNNKTVGGILMDLSKAFDCIPHDILVAELTVYHTDDNRIPISRIANSVFALIIH